MITYKDIDLAITNKLIQVFNVEVNSNDVKKGFNRPSFFVSFDNQKRSSNDTQIEKALTIRIYYFPKDKDENSIELMDMQDQLENVFDLKLKVLDRKFNIQEVNPIVTDGVLEFSFDIEFFDAREKSYSESQIYLDKNDNPMVDENGDPIEVELMQHLDIENEVD